VTSAKSHSAFKATFSLGPGESRSVQMIFEKRQLTLISQELGNN
jgi:hypothetical protein